MARNGTQWHERVWNGMKYLNMVIYDKTGKYIFAVDKFLKTNQSIKSYEKIMLSTFADPNGRTIRVGTRQQHLQH